MTAAAPTPATPGQAACETWQTRRTGTDRTGTWKLLSPEQRGHWEAAAQAAIAAVAPAGQADGEAGTALYLSAIGRLAAGLRDVQHACERGDAPYAISPVAASALADVDRLRLPQPQPAPGDIERALASVAAERNQYRIALERIADGSRSRDGMMGCASRALAEHPQPAPELDLAGNEMRPGELDVTLATVPPCEAVSSWGMRCRVIRAHETHRDRDGNMWQPEPQPPAEPGEEVLRSLTATLSGMIAEVLPAMAGMTGATPSCGKFTNPAGVARVLFDALRLDLPAQPAPELASDLPPDPSADELALAVERDQLEQRLNSLRGRVEDIALSLEKSALATHPSKKSAIEDGCATALRALLETT